MTRGLRVLAVVALVAAAGCDVVRARPSETGPRTVEVAVFEGGYGIDWHQKVAAEYSARHEVNVALWGDPRVAEKVKPRLLRGTPPDLLLMHQLPVWLLVGAGELRPLTAALDAPGDGGSWREQFTPGTLTTYTANGEVYALPSAFGAWACWYDARQFREHGWQVPQTWGQLLALSEQIRAAGVAPFAYQGKYPIYGYWTLISLIQRCGGLAAINRLNALEPGAWSHPDVLRAAGLLQQLAQEHFQAGALAMTHTDSQLQFVKGRAAMIFCGLWLFNEMKTDIPPAFEMRCFNVPAVEGGKGNPNLFNGAGKEFLFVPADAEQPEAAIDFARYMVSRAQAPDMARSIGVISPLAGAIPPEAVAPPLQSALDMIRDAAGIFDLRHEHLLLEWRNQVLEPALAELLRGELTPEAFGARLDAGVEAAKQRPGVFIPEAVQYDPAQFGEAAGAPA